MGIDFLLEGLEAENLNRLMLDDFKEVLPVFRAKNSTRIFHNG